MHEVHVSNRFAIFIFGDYNLSCLKWSFDNDAAAVKTEFHGSYVSSYVHYLLDNLKLFRSGQLVTEPTGISGSHLDLVLSSGGDMKQQSVAAVSPLIILLCQSS